MAAELRKERLTLMAINIETGKPLPVHPDYAPLRLAWDFWELSYFGGPAYKRGRDSEGEPVFVTHEMESEEGQRRRLRLATYRNYCRPILAKYNAFIFSTPIRRDGRNARFRQWAADVDALGSSLHDYMRRASLWACVHGRRFALVDSTKTAASQTLAQARAAHSRLFLIDLDPRRVLNWTVRGTELVEALIQFPEAHQARLYTANTLTLIETNPQGTVASAAPPLTHQYGRLPVVKIGAADDDLSLLADLAEANKSLFNLDALLREELFKQTFTQFFAAGLDAEDLKETRLGGRKLICHTNPDIRIDRLTSDVSQAESIRASLGEDIREIYRLAGLHHPEAVQGSESGRALKIRWNEVSLRAAAIADHAEKAENQIIELWRAGMGGAEQVEPSDYPEEFDAEDLAVELEMTLKVLSSPLPATLKQAQARSLSAHLQPKLTPQEWQRLNAELEALRG
jgi:hypothetical protein